MAADPADPLKAVKTNSIPLQYVKLLVVVGPLADKDCWIWKQSNTLTR